MILTYKSENISATCTDKGGRVIELKSFEPIIYIEPLELRHLEPAGSIDLTFDGVLKTKGVELIGLKPWHEAVHGHRGRRVVGRKIRQARRRMRRLFGDAV